MKICSIVGCERSAWSRDLCSTHYAKWHRYGDPLAGSTRRRNGEGFVTGPYKCHTVNGKKRPEHVLIVEKVLGREILHPIQVHHADGDPSNNSRGNLVVCPDQAYHSLLHRRMKALDECGHADWLKCCRCGNYGAPVNLRESRGRAYHPECNREHAKKMRDCHA